MLKFWKTLARTSNEIDKVTPGRKLRRCHNPCIYIYVYIYSWLLSNAHQSIGARPTARLSVCVMPMVNVFFQLQNFRYRVRIWQSYWKSLQAHWRTKSIKVQHKLWSIPRLLNFMFIILLKWKSQASVHSIIKSI